MYRQILERDSVVLGHQDGAFERMAKLADIARPLMRADSFDCRARNQLDVFAEQPVVVLDEVRDESGDSLTTLA